MHVDLAQVEVSQTGFAQVAAEVLEVGDVLEGATGDEVEVVQHLFVVDLVRQGLDVPLAQEHYFVFTDGRHLHLVKDHIAEGIDSYELSSVKVEVLYGLLEIEILL